MSLYDGLEIDAKEGGGRDKRPDVSGWGSSLKMLQVQKQLQAKNKASLLQPKRRGGPTIAPVIDLKKAGGDSLHFNQLTGKLERIAPTASAPAPPAAALPQPPSMFIAQDPPALGILTNLTGVNDEYNPFQPNDYDEYIKKRKENRKRDRDDRRSRNDRNDRDREEERHASPEPAPWAQQKERNHTPRSAGPGGNYDRERRRSDRGRRNHDEQEDRDESEFEKRRRRRAEEEEEEEERDRDRSRKVGAGAAIAPPQALLEDTGSPERRDSDSPTADDRESTPPPRGGLGAGFTAAGSVASKIMAKYGYREGQGLGKKEQGMSTALFVEKTSKRGGKIIHEKDMPKEMDMFGDNIDMEAVDSMNFPAPLPPGAEMPRATLQTNAELLKNPTKVILLRNMVGPGEVDDDLEAETSEECTKYGKVTKCIIFEIPEGDDDEAVRIFIEFERMESAIKAVVDLNGRYFGGRMVKACFYNLDKMRRLALADAV